MEDFSYYTTLACCLLIQVAYCWLAQHDYYKEKLTKAQVSERRLVALLVSRAPAANDGRRAAAAAAAAAVASQQGRQTRTGGEIGSTASTTQPNQHQTDSGQTTTGSKGVIGHSECEEAGQPWVGGDARGPSGAEDSRGDNSRSSVSLLVDELSQALKLVGFAVITISLCDESTQEDQRDDHEDRASGKAGKADTRTDYRVGSSVAQSDWRALVERIELEHNLSERSPGGASKCTTNTAAAAQHGAAGQSLFSYIDLCGLEHDEELAQEARQEGGAHLNPALGPALASGELLMAFGHLIVAHKTRVVLIDEAEEAADGRTQASGHMDIQDCRALGRSFRKCLGGHLRATGRLQREQLIELELARQNLRPARASRSAYRRGFFARLRERASLWLKIALADDDDDDDDDYGGCGTHKLDSGSEGHSRPQTGVVCARVSPPLAESSRQRIVSSIRDQLLALHLRTWRSSIAC